VRFVHGAPPAAAGPVSRSQVVEQKVCCMKINATTSTKLRIAGVGPLAALVLSAGVLLYQSDTPTEAEREAERALQERMAYEPDALSKADSSAIMRVLMQDALTNPGQVSFIRPERIDEETLWLARAIYSESKQPAEQELVAWTIRNRVETHYRGRSTYRGVVLDPYQFSGFNPNHPRRAYYLNLSPHGKAESWRRTLSIAFHVRHAPADLRPFSKETRHFYSERSMIGRAHPQWAYNLDPVQPDRHRIDVRRFRFLAGVV